MSTPQHQSRAFLFATFLFLLNGVFAQFNHYNTEKEIWNQGIVYLGSGEVLEGLVNYNFVVDQVRVDQNGEIKTFIPQSVSSFMLIDTSENSAHYVSLPFDMKNTGMEAPSFFLIIHQNSNYALLSKYVITYEARDFGQNNLGLSGGFGSLLDEVTEQVTQMIFLADKSARIKACLNKEVSYVYSVFWDSGTVKYSDDALSRSVRYKEVEKFRVYDKSAFQSFFGEDYHAFSRYVKQQDLNIRYIKDLMKALEFKE